MPAENMNFSSNLAKNTLRSLVGLKGWDYCVIWKLSEEQRFVEWMDCCCAGTDQSIEDGEVDRHFPPLSPILPCRDVMFQHPRSKSCELLAQLPSSMALDSGIHAQSLISNQPKWLNFSPISDSNLLEETIGTRVLIPIRGGLIELFVTKQVPEDQQVIDFIYSLEEQQEAILNNSSNNMDTCFSTIDNANNNNNNNNQPNMMNNGGQLQSSTNGDLPYDITVDRIRLCSPPMNFLHQFNHSLESKITTNNNGDHDHHIFFEGSHDQMQYVDATKEGNDNDSSMKHETRTGQQRSDSVSDNYCSDQNDDDEDGNSKGRRRSGKGPQSKNLIAERRRRKKLNDRLYALRSLVPRISKLDRASILGDAIEFVKELVKQVRELQDELEDHHHRHSDDEDEDDQNSVMPDIVSLSGVPSAVTTNKSGFYGTASIAKQNNNQDTESTADKAQQMEPQVEVSQKDVNEFFVKVFCEHKLGGFAKIMEALNSLGLEVTNANVTSFRGLVSNVFHVEKKDSEMVQADNLKESLIELTRNPSRGLWHREMMTAKEVAESNSVDYQQQQHYYHIHG